MYRIFLVIFAVIFTFFTFKAWAEDNSITATTPTTNEDGSPLTDLAFIRVYHSVNAQGGPYELLDSVAFTQTGVQFSYVHTNQLDGLHCYVATAVREGGQESVFSNEGCKLIDTILPNTLTNLVVN